MIACPNCKRRVFTRRDILHATLDGMAACRVCGRIARLDLLSRWIIACIIALVLPSILLYGEVFYSGHLFVVCILVVLGLWRLLSWVGLPLLGLEPVEGPATIERRHGVLTLAALLCAATVLDIFMASRFVHEEPAENARAQTAEHRAR